MTSCRLPALLIAGFASVLFTSTSRAAPNEIRGLLVGVDLAKNELRVERRGMTLTLTLDEKTLVLFGAEKGVPADLKTGRRVRVEFEEDRDGLRLARVVRSNGRPSSAPAATAGTPPPTVEGDAITGVLQRVSRADREIVVIGPGTKGPETETTIAIPENAKVGKDGKSSSLEALKEGDAVAVRAERRDGRLTAVEVQAGKGAGLTATPASERPRMIPRLRQALHLADEVLRRVEPFEPGSQEPKKP
jgi:cold shock CspA family protein